MQAGLAVIGNSTVKFENNTALKGNTVAVGFGDNFFQIDESILAANNSAENNCTELWNQVYSNQCRDKRMGKIDISDR